MHEQVESNHKGVQRRAANRRQQLRRKQVWRAVLPLALIGVLALPTAIWLRNREYVARGREAFEADLAELVRLVKESGDLPLAYSPAGEDDLPSTESGLTYIDAKTVRALGASDQPLVVAYSRGVRQLLGPDARVVAIRQGREIRVEVMDADQWRRTMDEQERRVAEAGRQAPTSPPHEDVGQ